MSAGPVKPIGHYPVADLGDLPQPPAPPAPVSKAAAPVPAAEAAVLDFLDPAAVRGQVTLRFPFRLDGAEIRAIAIRRLNGAEVGRIASLRGAQVELFDFYEAMAGFPKAVLRGLIDDDLEAFLDAARPFLCPFARDYLSSPPGASGAPSSDVPAGPSASPGPAP